ncbi:MAG TPA: esterase-like activity of phytase family protein [Allosphingosinicella sp.]
MRLRSALLALCTLPWLASFAPLWRYPPELTPSRVQLSVAPVALEETAPGRRRVGALTFLGGWSIQAKGLGGLSALRLEAGQATALSDAGRVVRFALPPVNRATAEILPLIEGPGPAFSKRNRDAEALDVEGGRLWVGYEGHNAIWRYDAATLAAQASAAPDAMAGWARNGGAEAMLRLPDGRFLIFEEGAADADGTVALLLSSRDPVEPGATLTKLRYRPPPGYVPVDAALLPDGRIAVLNRRFSPFGGFSARLMAGRLSGPVLETEEELAAFVPPVLTDNYEALAVTQENGRTILWMASDDNFNPLQRTLILKFALA